MQLSPKTPFPCGRPIYLSTLCRAGICDDRHYHTFVDRKQHHPREMASTQTSYVLPSKRSFIRFVGVVLYHFSRWDHTLKNPKKDQKGTAAAHLRARRDTL